MCDDRKEPTQGLPQLRKFIRKCRVALNKALPQFAWRAYRQPITRDGLKDIFGKKISRDQIGRLHARDLIGTGPRSPRRCARYIFVTTKQFLVAFGLLSLPDREQLENAVLVASP